MATVSKCSVQVRLDESLKKEAETVFDNLGVDTPTAIRMFFKKVVATRSIPFALEENPYVFSAEEEAEILAAAKESYDLKYLDGPFNSAKEAIAFLKANSKE
jgi:DNA-damage-inducible protein J